MNHNYVVIRKTGLFYNVFDNDAEILHYLLHYKIIDNRVGFPANALHKVKNILEDKKINYKVLDESKEYIDFKDLNAYGVYLAKSKNKILVGKKVDEIIKKLETKNEEELLKILESIEKLLNERRI